MKKLISIVSLAAVLALGVASAAMAGKGNPWEPPDDGLDCPDGQNIVVHLKRHINDLQGAQVAVRLATLLESQVIGEDEPVNVVLFLTLQGPRLVDPAQPQDLLFGSAPGTLGAVVEGFLGAGGTIFACPLCATEIGLEGDNLLYADTYTGQVKIPSGGEIAEMFLCADKVLDF